MRSVLCILCAASSLLNSVLAEVAPRAHLFSPHDPFAGKRRSKLWRKRQEATTCAASKTPWVFAQFLVAKAEDYTSADWLADIQLASNTGIDGFALSIGDAPWVPHQVQNAYDAALSSSLNFKLFVSFNMSEFQDPTQFLPFVTQYGLHTNQFIYSSKVFTSTIGGENETFDATTPNLGWQEWFKDQTANAGYPTYFVPSFPSRNPIDVFDDYSCLDGIASFEAWSTTAKDLTNQTDVIYQAEAAAVSKTYMMPISGSFFSHSRESNAVHRTENWALASRWEQAIALEPDFIQILSWNDFDTVVSRGLENDQLIRAQSSYIGPVRRKWQQPAYTQDMPHTAWLLLSQFYIQRYKTGAYPRVKKDTLIYWYRTHSKDAVARSDPVGPPAGWDSTEDAIYVLALLASPHASLVVKTGIIQTNSTLVQGLNRVKIEFVEGPVSLRLQQNGKTTAIAEPGPPISNTIDAYNFNPFVGSVTAP